MNTLSISSRVAARYTTGAALKNFMNDDFESAVDGVQHLIDQLEKAKNSLNPQDESRATLERAIIDFNALRDSLRGQTNNIKNINI
jgi:hypothetical protein